MAFIDDSSLVVKFSVRSLSLHVIVNRTTVEVIPMKSKVRLPSSLAVLMALVAAIASAGPAAADSATSSTVEIVGKRFHHLMDLANKHDIGAIHDMFWQSPSALLVAKNAAPSEENWAGFWGNAAIDQKLHDIASSGPVVLAPDYTKLKVVELSGDIAESYAPTTITVSYAGQDGRPRPFLLIVTWKKVDTKWLVASEIILPVPPAPPQKG